MLRSDRPSAPMLRRIVVVLIGVAALLGGQPSVSGAQSSTVTAVQGSAYGYRAYNLSLFGGPQPEVGPTPVVTLPSDGSEQTATDPTGLVFLAETAVLLTSDTVRATTDGTFGPAGSVTSSATLTNVNKATTQQALTGSEIVTADTVVGNCNASQSERSGDTTITNGWLQTDSGWDANEDGDYNDAGDLPRVVVPLPSDPTVGQEFTGVVRFGGTSSTPDNFRIVLNEQVVGPGQTVTVNAVHEYFLGHRLRGDLILGRSTCGVTVGPGPTNGRPANDFDGDSASDIGVYRPSSGVWYLRQSAAGGAALAFGAQGDIPVPADYDGDGKADVAVFRPSTGVWYLLRSTAGGAAITFGAGGDIPVPADYDGDGKADIGVYRPSTGVWYLLRSTAGGAATPFGGVGGDIPVVGDYDGDGKADLGIFRPSTGVWYLLRSTAGGASIPFGVNGDIPVPADYDGDGKTDVAVLRPSTGVWYQQYSAGGGAATPFGVAGDIPALGDYDADGRADIGVYRPSTSVWYVQRSTSGPMSVVFGSGGDLPLGLPNAIYRFFF